ncbi:MAG: ABC transporter ATP-binding protein [Methanolinea sp.]
MTEQIALRVSHISKQYKLGGTRENYSSIREVISNSIKSPSSRLNNSLSNGSFWALKDVTMDIKKGEVIGIIGRNGAGKSTLLKILSRITFPTSGYIELNGRVGSLLEVGTGFHPELTGRENIFLSGSILGMKRCEIEKKLFDIVNFSEIEKFLDTPVKRYSSGMYVRLAFAVAAHMEPEILLVDEVLAVGDAAFQKKCLGKMGDVAKEGRTILFVSHNMNAIRNLCTKTAVLDKGNITFFGKTIDGINFYNSQLSDKFSREKYFDDIPNKSITLLKMCIYSNDNKENGSFDVNSAITIEIEYRVKMNITGTNIAISIIRDGINIIWSFDIDQDKKSFYFREKGDYCSRIILPPRILGVGLYSVYFDSAIYNKEHISKYHDCLIFKIENFSMDMMSSVNLGGIINVPLEWHTRKNNT